MSESWRPALPAHVAGPAGARRGGVRHGLALVGLGLGVTVGALAAPASTGAGAEAKTEPADLLAGGGYHSVALARSGKLWVWGAGAQGQIGDGGRTDRFIPFSAKVPAGVRLVGIAAGVDFSLAVAADGSVWAWGGNSQGQLGTAAAAQVPDLVRVEGLPPITAVAAGKTHALALSATGEVWSWGRYNAPEARTGEVATAPAQVARPTRVKGLAGILAVAAGAEHDLALDREGGVWAWGDNQFGQLGRKGDGLQPKPVRVKGLAGPATGIAAGQEHSLVLLADGTLWAWGGNAYGQLGDGTTQPHPVPVRVPGLTEVRQISCGAMHSVALRRDGTVWSWGDNGMGQLGAPGRGRANGPVPMLAEESTPPEYVSGIVQIACGGYHTLLARQDGLVLAVGHNLNGQLGNWETWDRNLPVRLYRPCFVLTPGVK